MNINKLQDPTWKESIFRQREELARMLREPLAQLSKSCVASWGRREMLNERLRKEFSGIPYCHHLYIVDDKGVQVCDNIKNSVIIPGYFKKNRSTRPYMLEPMPAWGFLLSDAYVSEAAHRPSLTALHTIVSEAGTLLGYLGAEFDLRKLPVTSALYTEPYKWRQVKGDPSIRGALFKQDRIESLMDTNSNNAMSIIEELLTEYGVFQCQIHFSSSQVTIWSTDDPLRYRIIDHEMLNDTDICLLYRSQTYPDNAEIPRPKINMILKHMYKLRMIDTNVYLRMGSINIFNGMVSLTFSCDGTHYMPYDEFLNKGVGFWTGLAA